MRVLDAQPLLPECFHFCAPYRYQLLVDDVSPGGLNCEDYGFAICDPATGERAEVRRVTPNQTSALHILALLSRNQVSPVHLRDVLDDCLAI